MIMPYDKTRMEEFEDNVKHVFFQYSEDRAENGRRVDVNKYVAKMKAIILEYFIKED